MPDQSPEALAAFRQVSDRTRTPYVDWPVFDEWPIVAEEPSTPSAAVDELVVCGCRSFVGGGVEFCPSHARELDAPWKDCVQVVKAWACGCRVVVDDLLPAEARQAFLQERRCDPHDALRSGYEPGSIEWSWSCPECGAGGPFDDCFLDVHVHPGAGAFEAVPRVAVARSGKPLPEGSDLLHEIDPITGLTPAERASQAQEGQP